MKRFLIVFLLLFCLYFATVLSVPHILQNVVAHTVIYIKTNNYDSNTSFLNVILAALIFFLFVFLISQITFALLPVNVKKQTTTKCIQNNIINVYSNQPKVDFQKYKSYLRILFCLALSLFRSSILIFLFKNIYFVFKKLGFCSIYFLFKKGKHFLLLQTKETNK